MTAVATSLAETGDPEQAVALGEQALAGLRRGMGPLHPHTLACAVNLAIDLRSVGDDERARVLADDAMTSYLDLLPADHFDVLDAEAGERIIVDFEAPLL